MKRFYCTVCKRMKRAQSLPRIIRNADSKMPRAREGQCNRHSVSANRRSA